MEAKAEVVGDDGVRAGGVKQMQYRRSETPITSDHKPVAASFCFGCKQVLILISIVRYGKAYLYFVL